MKKLKLILSVFLFIFCGESALSFAEPLKVLSVSGKGENAVSARMPISLTFNQPVAALSQERAFAAEECPLLITPSVQGVCRFVGTKTLQFEPTENWPLATAYQVRLKAGFASEVSAEHLPQDYHFSFTTQRPQVESVSPADGEQWIDTTPLIFVQLSQAADLASARQAVQLTYQTDQALRWWETLKERFLKTKVTPQQQTVSVPVSVRFITPQEHKEQFSWLAKENILVLKPQKALPVGSRITLTLSDALRGQEGTLGLKEKFVSHFYTYPALQVKGVVRQGCLPYEAQIQFSSPVRLEELLKHIQVSPDGALRTLTEQEKQTLGIQHNAEGDGNGYFAMPLSFVQMQPKEPVHITIDKNLTDIYGQALGEEQHIVFENSGYCPAVDFQGGNGVLESYLPARHPIDVLNVAELDVKAARFNKENFIPFLQQTIPHCSEAELDKSVLQYDGAYPFQTAENKTKKTYLDLKKFHPTGQNSIIFSQVKIPSKHRKEGYCWLYSTDNITDLGLTLKSSPEKTLLWVTSLQSGQPKGGLSVELKDDSNTTLWKGSTDENGLAWAPGTSELKARSKNKWSRPTLYAFVTSSGGDGVLASSWNSGLEPWRFNINYDYLPAEISAKTVLFTDRGIYRPGETLYIKGISRQKKQGSWALPSSGKGTLKILNPRGDVEAEREIVYHKQSGAFDLRFDLPDTAITGVWQLYFAPQGGGEDAYATVRVEAVQQADFAVSARSLQTQYVGGEKAQFAVKADYLFGAPVAGGKVQWTLRISPSFFSVERLKDYEFVPYFLLRDFTSGNHLLRQSTATLDEKGQVTFSADLPSVSLPQNLHGQVSVQDLSGQELFTRFSVPVAPASFYLGSKLSSSQVELGETLQAHIVAVTPEGKAVVGKKVTAKIQKEEFLSVRKNGLAGRLEWVSERRVKEIEKYPVTVSDQGANLSLHMQEPGTYQVLLESTDEKGRKVRGGFEFTVYGKGKAYWKQTEDDLLALQQDKPEYDPSDTARILVKSPYENAWALVTVEREGVLDAWTVPVSAGADYISVPLKSAYVPNVFVGVTLVRGRAETPQYDKDGLDLAKPQGKTGYVNLTLSQKEREIQTQLILDKKTYQPAEEVEVKLKTSLQGKPVAADITLLVVDEGVLALTQYQMPDLLQAFYGQMPLSVLTADNRVFLIGQRNFGEKGENRGGGGADTSKWDGTDLRSHFEFTPYFNGQLRTDAKGRGKVRFTLPDNLTSFRLMALAATTAEFGGAEQTIQVSKNLMITPKLPRFARQADRFTCGAVVHNYSAHSAKVSVSAQAQGAVSLTEKEHTLSLPPAGSTAVSWPCYAKETGEAKLLFRVQSAQDHDAVEKQISVLEIEKPQTLSLYSATDKTEEQLLRKPAPLQSNAEDRVELSLASTALLNLRGSLLYLLEYPYDCLEQKMSKILPLVQGAELLKDFDIADTEAYRSLVQEILNQMPQYQATTGGYAYWPSFTPDPYVTAYALEVAHWAEKAGYKLPASSTANALAWLKGVFGKNLQYAFAYSDSADKTIRAYAVYVLSLYGEKMNGQFNNLYTQRNALSAVAKAYLLQSASLLNQPQTVKNQLAQALLNHAVYGAETLHFTEDKPQNYLPINDEKVTALALQALLASGNYLPQPYQAVRWLIGQLNTQGHWQNTHANAAAFSALYTYYTLQEKTTADFKATVLLDGKEALKKTFKGRSLQSQEQQWPMHQFYQTSDAVRVRLDKKGAGKLYYNLRQIYTPPSYQDVVNAGFSVSRQITDLQGKPVEKLKEGQRYKVSLTVNSAGSYSFVVLEDFIPAGFEIVHTDLATQAQPLSAASDPNAYFNRSEVYEDRLAVFADSLPAGEHTYHYWVQARTAGRFSYPSLWASQMYDPAVFGRNATHTIEIEKL